MNKYDLFLEPRITEQGNHMVMTNVQKQDKVKYVNVDSKFKDEYFDNVNENKNGNWNGHEDENGTVNKNKTETETEHNNDNENDDDCGDDENDDGD